MADSGWRRDDEFMKDSKLLDFEDMEVWQGAQDLAVDVYTDFSNCRDFSFVDQFKRAVVSISNNVAEGSERTTPVEFARFLDEVRAARRWWNMVMFRPEGVSVRVPSGRLREHIAKGSSGEVRSMYRLAERLQFVDDGTAMHRCGQCESISRQLGGFAKHLRRK